MSVVIEQVCPHSICGKKGILPGSTLVSINGNEIKDVLDYRFYITETKLRIEIITPDGKKKTIKIKKDETEDPGLEFGTYLMDRQHSCKNKCIFCFIDQNPKGMRDSIYFKDDDDRLSFLFGNYVTLTNLDDSEVERLIKMHISPINISVHTMNPELRNKMMANPHSGESLKYIKKFADAGLSINAQLVLCPGINDGAELIYSLEKLAEYYPALCSVACVPVGLTKHRNSLYPLKNYDKETAGEVIDSVDDFNEKFLKAHGNKIAYASDEFYLIAERKLPDMDYYDDFPQLDNGVGMWTLLEDEFMTALESCTLRKLDRTITIVTGTAAFPLIEKLALEAQKRIDGLNITVIAVKNNLFGDTVTVSGLIGGEDIYNSVKDIDIGDELIIPPNCLRSEGDMFIDSVTTDDLAARLGVRITQNKPGGEGLLEAMTGGITWQEQLP